MSAGRWWLSRRAVLDSVVALHGNVVNLDAEATLVPSDCSGGGPLAPIAVAQAKIETMLAQSLSLKASIGVWGDAMYLEMLKMSRGG